MKQRAMQRLIGFLIVFVGLIAMNYPLLAGWINDRYAYRDYEEYQTQISQEDSELQQLLETAHAFNAALAAEAELTEFQDFRLLQIDAPLGFLEIPQIGVNMAVHYSTDAKVAQKNLCLVEETSLPVGGESTHAVISGHTGLAARRMLTDLTQIKKDDIFFMHILGEDLAYQVDRVTIVEPWDASALKIIPGEDYLTLLTCTPYGVNDHRLLVRGKRIDYDFSEEQNAELVQKRLSVVEEIRLVVAALSILILLYMLFLTIRFFVQEKRSQ